MTSKFQRIAVLVTLASLVSVGAFADEVKKTEGPDNQKKAVKRDVASDGEKPKADDDDSVTEGDVDSTGGKTHHMIHRRPRM